MKVASRQSSVRVRYRPARVSRGLPDRIASGHRAPLPGRVDAGADEEQDVRYRLEQLPKQRRELGAPICRLAYALLAVDGKLVSDEFPSLEERIEWVGSWPASLIKAAIDQYEVALFSPLAALNDILRDPYSVPAPSTSGAWWSGA